MQRRTAAGIRGYDGETVGSPIPVAVRQNEAQKSADLQIDSGCARSFGQRVAARVGISGDRKKGGHRSVRSLSIWGGGDGKGGRILNLKII